MQFQTGENFTHIFSSNILMFPLRCHGYRK